MAHQIKNFSVFTGVGIVQFLVQTFLLWLLIDLLKYHTLFTTSIVTVIIYLAKYLSYIRIGLMQNKFIKYNIVNLSTMLVSIAAIWLLVDFAGWYASLSTVFVAVILLVLRFIIFEKIGMIKER